MGWLSYKKKEKRKYYTSVTNMSGPPGKPIKYLSSVVSTKVLGNGQGSLGDTIVRAVLNGPGMHNRRFGKWLRTSGFSDLVGWDGTRLFINEPIDTSSLLPFLPHPVGSDVVINESSTGTADASYWVDQWMLNNHPTEIDLEYELDSTGVEGSSNMTITFNDGHSYVIPLDDMDYDPNGLYLYVSYNIIAKNTAEPLVPGPFIEVPSPAEFPSTAGYTNVGTTTGPKTVNLNTHQLIEVTYSDGRPPETSTRDVPYTQEITEEDDVWEMKEYIGSNPVGNETNSLLYILHRMHTGVIDERQESRTDTETLPGGVVKSTKTTTTYQDIRMAYGYHRDTQIITDRKWSQLQTFIYKKGSGTTALDALFPSVVPDNKFMPMLPIANPSREIIFKPWGMVWGYLPVRQGDWPGTQVPEYRSYLTAPLTAAWKKLYNGADFIKWATDFWWEIWNNEFETFGSQGTNVLFGVPLNVGNKSGRKYVYKFFQAMLDQGGGGFDELQHWQTQWDIADRANRAWFAWKGAQQDSNNPLFGTPEPALVKYPVPRSRSVSVSSYKYYFNSYITWSALSETKATGKGWPGARVNDVRIAMGSTAAYEELVISGGIAEWRPSTSSLMTITWQTAENEYQVMGVWDLVHTDTVASSGSVQTTAAMALGTAAESVFLLPIHEDIYREMSLLDSHQMTDTFSYLHTKKQVIYYTGGTGLFKFTMIIITIVWSVITAGAATGPMVGLLGSAAAIGVSLGFSGAWAVLVGTIVNAAAAMLLAQLITMGAVALFGDKIGPIIGAIASMFAVSYGTAYMNGGTSAMASFNMAEMFTAENFIKLSVAVTGSYASFVDTKTQDLLEQTRQMMSDYDAQTLENKEHWNQTLGEGISLLDPLAMVNIASLNKYTAESPAAFMGRTLMTGSDIATMTNSIIGDFTNISLSTQLPT